MLALGRHILLVLRTVCRVQLTVGMADGKRLVVTVEEDGRDLDTVVGLILTSLSSIFSSLPTEYVLHVTFAAAACLICASAVDVHRDVKFSHHE